MCGRSVEKLSLRRLQSLEPQLPRDREPSAVVPGRQREAVQDLTGPDEVGQVRGIVETPNPDGVGSEALGLSWAGRALSSTSSVMCTDTLTR